MSNDQYAVVKENPKQKRPDNWEEPKKKTKMETKALEIKGGEIGFARN